MPDHPAETPPPASPLQEPVSPPAAMSSRDRVAGRVAWIVIVVLVGAVVAMQNWPSEPPPPTAWPDPAPAFQSQMQAKLIYGVKRVADDTGETLPTTGPFGYSELADQLSELAPPPAGHMHAAVAHAVLDQPAAARTQLSLARAVVEDKAAAIGQMPDSQAPSGTGTDAPGEAGETDEPSSSEQAAAARQDIEDLERALFGDRPLDDATRDRLIDRLGGIGEIAVAVRADESDPVRQRLDREAGRMIAVLIGFAALLVTLLIVCTALGIIAIVLLVKGKIHSAFARLMAQVRGTPHPAWAEAFAIFMASFLILSVGSRVIETNFGFDPSHVAMWFMVPLIAWPLLRGRTVYEWRATLGLHTGRGVLREIGAGIAGYLALLPIVAAGLLITIGLVLMSAAAEVGGTPTHPIAEQTQAPAWTLYLLAAVWAPLTEEMFFRGALFAALRRRLPIVAAGLISGVIFAIIHPQGPLALPVLTALGFNFAMLREWRGSLIAPMIAHAMHNATLVTLLINIT